MQGPWGHAGGGGRSLSQQPSPGGLWSPPRRLGPPPPPGWEAPAQLTGGPRATPETPAEVPDGGGIAHAKPPREPPFWQAGSGPFMTFSGEGARAGFTAVTLLCDDLSSPKAPSSVHSWAGPGARPLRPAGEGAGVPEPRAGRGRTARVRGPRKPWPVPAAVLTPGSPRVGTEAAKLGKPAGATRRGCLPLCPGTARQHLAHSFPVAPEDGLSPGGARCTGRTLQSRPGSSVRNWVSSSLLESGRSEGSDQG